MRVTKSRVTVIQEVASPGQVDDIAALDFSHLGTHLLTSIIVNIYRYKTKPVNMPL